MIITQSRLLETRDTQHYSWTGLSRFKNVSFTSKRITAYQNVPQSQERNVRKQANQIRSCIVQAQEYFSAARSVSLATKPLLLYYGTMSLALAELLIKQTGESSLDKARGEHAHHGLTLRIDGNPSNKETLTEGALALRAVPLIRGSERRFGTFDLWHRSSRETPFSGKQVTAYANGVSLETHGTVATGSDERPALLPYVGLTLLDCFQSTPTMMHSLSSLSTPSKLARGRVESRQDNVREIFQQLTFIYPERPEVLDKTLQDFTFSPGMIDCVNVDFPAMAGGVVTVSLPFICGNHNSTAPFGFQLDQNQVYFSPFNRTLNEFGLFYFGLYILGNYARYYPDYWMADVENASPLSLAASDFLLSAEERVPLLSYSELLQVFHIRPN